MKSRRLHFAARTLIVAFVMFSWLLATNHCAFGLMKPTAHAAVEHARCCTSVPSKQAPANGQRECCQTLQGMPAAEQMKAAFDPSTFQLQLFVLLESLVPLDAEQVVVSSVFDQGPPRAFSFAETVLQRSLFSHAPPSAV